MTAPAQDALYAYFARLADDGRPAPRQADIADDLAMTRTAMRRTLGRLMARGRIRTEATGKGCVYHLDDGRTLRTEDARVHKMPEGTRRPCMCCGDPFLSEGRFHRLCPKCTRGAGVTVTHGGAHNGHRAAHPHHL